jgi:hypothetical protein
MLSLFLTIFFGAPFVSSGGRWPVSGELTVSDGLGVVVESTPRDTPI